MPDQLYTAQDSRDIDQRVIGSGTVSGYELMSRAGRFSFGCIRERFPDAGRMVILCGTGNNGGDGYIVAGLAAECGIEASVLAYGAPATPDAIAASEFAAGKGAEIAVCDHKPDLSEQLKATDLIVDALLGTGVDREISGYLATIIGWVNACDTPVVACDIPTGLNSDTGRVMGHCITANATQTFITLKAGLFTGSGKAQSGIVQFSDLGVAAEYYHGNQPSAILIDPRRLAKLIRPRSESAHKGTTGYAAIIGGAPGMTGAILMAGSAAYRTGCGRVKAITHIEHASTLALACPELLTLGCDEATGISDRLGEFNTIAVGPGLGQTLWARRVFSQALDSRLPLVIDADGLNLLSKNRHKRSHWILTPHPGEASRLLNCTTADIQNDRYAAAREISDEYGGVCVLKGSGTLIAAQDRLTHVCQAGNAGQATAGMGDVLTGCIAGFLAQGYDLFDAACLGTWCHASAADSIAGQNGQIGMMATDLLIPIQKMHNELIDATMP